VKAVLHWTGSRRADRSSPGIFVWSHSSAAGAKRAGLRFIRPRLRKRRQARPGPPRGNCCKSRAFAGSRMLAARVEE
jgi:hypothetical protein